jgi:hypothetical protein
MNINKGSCEKCGNYKWPNPRLFIKNKYVIVHRNIIHTSYCSSSPLPGTCDTMHTYHLLRNHRICTILTIIKQSDLPGSCSDSELDEFMLLILELSEDEELTSLRVSYSFTSSVSLSSSPIILSSVNRRWTFSPPSMSSLSDTSLFRAMPGPCVASEADVDVFSVQGQVTNSYVNESNTHSFTFSFTIYHFTDKCWGHSYFYNYNKKYLLCNTSSNSS